uniref:G_PROTEIN_RECEP_F1_2 domain-containing protein n=1 Tax=Heterorhabditis bacteriophora TaxID=37862 RepID=A0A1I7XLA0_HETBA
MYLTIGDLIYVILVTFITLTGLFANIFLLFLILLRSPKYLSPYKIFLGNTAITQMCLVVVTLLIQPRVITVNMRIVNIYLGPSQFFGPWWSYMLYVIMLHLGVNSFISLMLSMVYRCIALRTNSFPKYGAYLMCLFGYIVPASMVISMFNIKYTNDPNKNAMLIHNEIPDLEKYLTVVGVEINQSIVPVFTIFPSSLTYMLTQFGIIETHMYSYFIVNSLNLGAVIDPIVTIYYVSPYKKFVNRVLLRLSSRQAIGALHLSKLEVTPTIAFRTHNLLI